MLGKQPPTQFGFDNLPPHPPPTRWSELLQSISQLLDFEPIRDSAGPYFAECGRPSLDPILMFKMMLVGYLLDIPSDRRLVEECADRASVREFLGLGWSDPLPVHASFTHWRQRLGADFFREALHEVVRQCAAHGMVLSAARTVDATTVKAQASKRGPTVAVPQDAAVDEFVETCFEQDREHGPYARSDHGEVIGQLPPTEAEDDAGAGHAAGEARSGSGEDRTILINTHDPEARLQRKSREIAQFRYNVSFCTDVATGLITDATATGFERAETAVDHLWRDPGQVRELAADRLYDSGQVLQALQQRGVSCYVPAPRSSSGGRIDKSQFSYLEMLDRYICPRGAELKLSRDDARRGQRHYTALVSDCKGCPDKRRCTPAARRSLSRQYAQGARDRAVRSGHRYWLLQRQRRINEYLHMVGKRDHGLSRARGLGLEAMRIQAAMTAVAIDLKRLVGFGGRVVSPAAAERARLCAMLALLGMLIARSRPQRHRGGH